MALLRLHDKRPTLLAHARTAVLATSEQQPLKFPYLAFVGGDQDCFHRALTDGLSIARIAQLLSDCTHTIRNYVADHAPIPWHRIELLRLLARKVDAPPVRAVTASTTTEQPAVVANVETDPACPGALLDKMLAWVGVHVAFPLQPIPHFVIFPIREAGFLN